MGKFALIGLLPLVTENPLIVLLGILLLAGAGYSYLSGGVFRTSRALDRWMIIRSLERTVRTNPHDAAARADLGRLLIEAGRPARALPHLEAARARAPDVPETRYYLGAARLGVGDSTTGRSLILEALAEDPRLRYGEPRLTLATYHLDHREPAEALEHLERFTALHSSSVEGRYKLARALLATAQPARARALLDEAIQAYRGSPSFKRREERLWRLRVGWLRWRLVACRLMGRGPATMSGGWRRPR
jgi:tetratricopeptide (TPR) repeat protein